MDAYGGILGICCVLFLWYFFSWQMNDGMNEKSLPHYDITGMAKDLGIIPDGRKFLLFSITIQPYSAR